MRATLPVMLLLVIGSPVFTSPVFATDGVLEINQACAVNGGCFTGDAPGLPVTISASGSYRLTSNLSAGANIDGIFLNTSRVTIDFNGFTLSGPSIGSGTGNGIAGGGTDGSFAGFTTIKNGFIRGARALAVALGGANGVRIEDMTIEFNIGGGVKVGNEARILKNTFSDNGSTSTDNHGLVAGNASIILQNVVSGSGGRGILVGSGSTVSANTSFQNGGSGIWAGTGSIMVDNTAFENGNYGIRTYNGATISRNSLYQNESNGIYAPGAGVISGNTVHTNKGIGIYVETGSLVSENSVSFNESYGIHAGSGCTISGNTVFSNGDFGLKLSGSVYRDNYISLNSGTVSNGINAGGNVCQGSLTCP